MTKTIKMEKWDDKYISHSTRFVMLCDGVLHKLFDFPDAEVIYLKMSDKVLSDSYKINIFNESENSIEIEESSYKNIALFQSMFDEIYSNFRKGCYCQLTFEV